MAADEHPISQVDPNDTQMDLNCAALRPYILFLREKFGSDGLVRILAETRMSLSHMEDAHNWVSFDYVCRLLAKLVEVTGDSNAPFDAARLYTHAGSFRAVAAFLTHLGTPATAFRLAVDFTSLWNRISRWKMLSMEGNRCVIQVHYPKHRQDRNNCMALQGSLAAIPRQFGLPFATITELKCACHGFDACEYEITWTESPRRRWGLTGGAIGLAVGTGFGAMIGWGPSGLILMGLTGIAGYFMGRGFDYRIRLADVYRRSDMQAESLLEVIRRTEKLNEELQRRVEERTLALSSANRELESALRELKESQESRILAERQAAIGILAAGTAHELNSPLNAIRLCTQDVMEEIPVDRPLRNSVDNIARSAGRCQRIVRELLAFSRDPRQVTDARLDDILGAAVAIFEKESPDQIRVRTSVEPDIPNLVLDRIQIQQAILNLLNNAADAMEGRGEIEVALATEDTDVVIRVTDHGPGISDEVRRSLFDPFVTTKKGGKGLGLGLCITYQLVTKNDGSIDVVTATGTGTTFSIRFPIRSEHRISTPSP